MFYNNILGRPNKKHIITRDKAYHGSTYLTGSITGKDREKNNFDFEKNFIHHLSSPLPYRRKKEQTIDEFCKDLVEEFEQKIDELGAENVAAFIAEPILASGGCIVPPEGYFKKIYDICKKNEIIFIADEVVTGFGRLGHFFSSEEIFGVVPDIITCAKGITSGYLPLGAVLFSDQLIADLKMIRPYFFMDTPTPVTLHAVLLH